MHRVLIIGCGKIAGGFDEGRPDDAAPLTHAGAYAQDPRFTLAACVEPHQARREEFQKRWNVAEAAADLGGIAAQAGAFDVVSVCSPTACHAADLEAALALRPRLIFCEKPVAASLAEAERLVERAGQAGVRLAVNYTRRWAPDVVELARELGNGDWGALRSASGTYTKGIVHNGGHMVDLLRLLLGELSLVAAGGGVRDFREDDPTVPALLTSAAGVPVQLSIGDARDYALFELSLVTERGAIAMLDGGQSWAIRRVGDSPTFAGYRGLGPAEIVPGAYDQAMARAVANIADALDHDSPLASDGRNALAAQRLCEAIRSAAAGPTPLQGRHE
jgi:predicted dehydrogenase